jgi:hypothetical protein
VHDTRRARPDFATSRGKFAGSSLPLRATRGLSIALALTGATHALAAPATCEAQSARVAPAVVELYTSEGCSSCPPADRWLSSIAARPGVIALAFHVSYWDRLGWADRFASPAWSERQAQQQAVNGARYSYTPQVVIDGVDTREWAGRRELRSPPVAAAPVQLRLRRDAMTYLAEVALAPLEGANRPLPRLAAYWAVTEDGLRSKVTAGENAGASLAHDAVVREFQSVPAWDMKATPVTTLQWRPASTATGDHPRHINLVVIDATTGRPVQALRLDC